MAPVKRGLLGACLDRAFTWANGLPPETSSYSIETLRIPVTDGVKIAANLYQPSVASPAGTILVRSPYGIGIPIALGHARIFAARGYQVLLSSCRGAPDSGGELDPGRNEAADGQAIVAWMRKQAWYTGAFATLGASYMGFVQWALLSDPPADMKAAIINTGPHDFANLICGTGAISGDVIAWADFLTCMRHRGTISQLLYLRTQKSRIRPVQDSVSLLPALDKYFKGDTPTWLRQMIVHPDPADPFWKPMRHENALGRANIPILLVTGWYDLVMQEPMKQYSRLAEHGCNVALTVGPWTHLGAGGRNTMIETLSWLDEYLAEKPASSRPSPVRVFVTGAEEWRNLPKWPPPTLPQELFLCQGKQLSGNAPSSDGPDSVFKFDPADPTPAIGAPELFDNGSGKREDDTALATRSDVVTFTSEPLTQDLEVCGRPSVELHHSSDHPHVDLLVLLSEVDSAGISHSISETYMRLDVARKRGHPLNLALRDCAHRFHKGARIRLLIAGGSHPRYLRNLGTGENPGMGTTLRPAWHTVQHKPSAISKLVLPVTAPEQSV